MFIYGLKVHLEGIRIKFVYKLCICNKPLIRNNSGSEDRAIKFAFSLGFLATVDRMV